MKDNALGRLAGQCRRRLQAIFSADGRSRARGLLHRVHPAVLLLVAAGSLCFAVAMFMSAYFIQPEDSAVVMHFGEQQYLDDGPDGGDGGELPSTASEEDGQPEAEENPQADGESEMFTILLVGTQDDWNTDTIMVARLDTQNRTLNVISIPRDTKVNVRRNPAKINAAYGAAKNADDPMAGINGLRRELASLIGFYPNYYAMVDMQAFVTLVDELGGVSFNVPVTVTEDVGDMTIQLEKGETVLDGKTALGLMRHRHKYADQDFTRMRVQQDFLMAIARQTLQLGNLFKINRFAEIAEENLTTNLGFRDMVWCLSQLLAMEIENVRFETLPVTMTREGGGADPTYVFVKPEEALALINEMINPYSAPITSENVIHPLR